mgnify:FL=1
MYLLIYTFRFRRLCGRSFDSFLQKGRGLCPHPFPHTACAIPHADGAVIAVRLVLVVAVAKVVVCTLIKTKAL